MAYLDNFHHQIVGIAHNPKLVFLHGIMGFGANWRRIAKAFGDQFQVLTFDQRGHGRSFQPPNGYSPRDYAEDLLKILDELQWRKITLVGHSMGGRNALEFATLYPERLQRLVIEDIGPGINKTGAELILRLVNETPVPFPSKREAKSYFEGEFLKNNQELADAKGLADFLNMNLIEDESGRAIWRFFVPGIRSSLAQGRTRERWDQIEGLKMPTLLLRGESSKDFQAEVFHEVLRRNPRIEGHEIKGAGHWIHSDQPEKFIEVLASFFARNPVET